MKLRSKQAHRATHWPRVHGPPSLAGVWLRAEELDISATLWLGKEFSLLY